MGEAVLLRRKSTTNLYRNMTVSKALAVLKISEREFRELPDAEFRSGFDETDVLLNYLHKYLKKHIIIIAVNVLIVYSCTGLPSLDATPGSASGKTWTRSLISPPDTGLKSGTERMPWPIVIGSEASV